MGGENGIPSPPPLSGVTAISAGFNGHVVALKSDGTVVAWGPDTYGETKVPAGLSGVTAISAGKFHTVALKSDRLSRATAQAQVGFGFMLCVSVLGGGHGYTEPPLVDIKGGGGTGATALAIVRGGAVVGFTVTNLGIGYTSSPQVLIALPPPPFPPEIGIEVSRVNVKVKLKVVIDRKYQLQTSKDLKVWTATGPDFVAQAENRTQNFVLAEVVSYFRVVEVP